LWRTRISRHIRACDIDTQGSARRVATNRLLVGLAMVPVPIALSAALRGKTVAAGTASANAFTVATAGGASGLKA
jgi:hypothetical protein